MDKITEAWSATNVESKILWIKADRETIEMLRSAKKESETPIDIEFKEFTPRNHMQIKNQIKKDVTDLKKLNPLDVYLLNRRLLVLIK